MAFFLGAALAGALVVGSSAFGQQSASVDIAPFIAQEIAPNVHLLTTPDDFATYAIGNVLLIEQTDGFVVVDSGFDAANGRAVVRYARSLANKPIKAVAITHWHSDHPLGVSAIRDAYPKVRIISTLQTEAGLLGPTAFDVGYAPSKKADAAIAERVRTDTAEYRKIFDDPATSPDRKKRIGQALDQFDHYLRDARGNYIVPPTETFEYKLVIDDPVMPVQLLFLGRANTAGDLVTWLPKQRIVEAGDIVVSPYPFGFGSYPADWIETLKKLKTMKFRTLIPGHGHPQTDASYLDRLITTISAIRSQVGPLAKQGLSLEEVRKRVDFTKVGDPFGTSSIDRENFKTLFSDPMTDMAYKEARGIPIIQGEGMPEPHFTEPAPKSRAIHHKN